MRFPEDDGSRDTPRGVVVDPKRWWRVKPPESGRILPPLTGQCPGGDSIFFPAPSHVLFIPADGGPFGRLMGAVHHHLKT
jgi:hypothetical protein